MNELTVHKNGSAPPEQLERDVERARLRLMESAAKVRDELKPLRVAAEFVRKHPYACAAGAFAVGALLGALWQVRENSNEKSKEKPDE
jgi:ElaB/YqjD/DUF883 family membrane-anchored ribosome-binding protein